MSVTPTKKVIPISVGWESLMKYDLETDRPPGGKTIPEIIEERRLAGKTHGKAQVQRIVRDFLERGKLKQVRGRRAGSCGYSVTCIYYVPVN